MKPTGRITDPAAWLSTLLDIVGSGRHPVSGLRQCPAHHDPGPSLSVSRGDDGVALVRCQAGCPTIGRPNGERGVVEALRIEARWLFTPPPASPAQFAAMVLADLVFPPVKVYADGSLAQQGYRLEAVHDYGSDHRKERLRRPGDGAKAVHWESRNPSGQWVPGLLGAKERDLPLYRERDLWPALAVGEPILLVESESSVDALVRAGWYATTWCGGAGSVYVATLRRVLLEHQPLILVPDHDEPGLRAATRIRAALPQALTLLGEPGEDARDLHHRTGGAGFRRAVEQLAAATPGRVA